MESRMLIGLVVSLLVFGAGNAQADAKVKYAAKIEGLWTKDTHPLEYPKDTLISGPHFSGVIGATHNADYSIFAQGDTATPGLERLSEMGKHDPLDSEIKSAMEAGKVGQLFETDPLKSFPGELATEIEIGEQFPMVSLVAMIAPSPDWFAGARNISLQDNGEWVEKRTVYLYAYDAGTDNGKTYRASDADAKPRQTIALNQAPHFMMQGSRVPVGVVTFTKQ